MPPDCRRRLRAERALPGAEVKCNFGLSIGRRGGKVCRHGAGRRGRRERLELHRSERDSFQVLGAPSIVLDPNFNELGPEQAGLPTH